MQICSDQGVSWFPGTSDIYIQTTFTSFVKPYKKDPTNCNLNFALYIVNLTSFTSTNVKLRLRFDVHLTFT